MQNNQQSLRQKFMLLRLKTANPKVIEYLEELLENLYIEVLGEYEGYLFDLMQSNGLKGWSWQTTESVVVFLKDDDYIERGTLCLDEKTPEYYHSWICFRYEGEEYVLDPCLNFICQKFYYMKIFKAKVKGRVSAKEVREELIRQLSKHKKEKLASLTIFFMFLYNKYIEKTKDEVNVDGTGDINTPFYKSVAGYRIKKQNGKIKKLKVHYYLNG